MVNQPRRKMVYDEFMEDVNLWPDLYTLCTYDYFITVWRAHFPEIRLRKHCRFTKCDFCVKWRAVATDRKYSQASHLDAKNRLKAHYKWARTKERGLYERKRNSATTNPGQYISISIDATDKFPNGFPHFVEKTKRDDSTRLGLHLVIAIVHGSIPYIFLANESIRSDPNLLCEVLTRVLLAEEKKRGELPPTLYLQLDNCIRENKNTYTEKYIEWLVERLVHREAFVSFLPVGHTHFDPDQLASRIGELLKHRNVTSIHQLIELLGKCYTPKPTVELIDDVLDWRALLNPEDAADFPVGTSMCRRLRGCTTKSYPHPGANYYMAECSPLHWHIRRDNNGHVFMQTQHTVESQFWSEPVFHWDTPATRPAGRDCHENASGLLPSDLVLAPRRPISQERVEELTRSLAGARSRLSDTASSSGDIRGTKGPYPH